jgi:hypothetical protein
MSNKSVIDKAIQQMQQKKADSREQRTGDYRIGLDAAINILENLRDMHRTEIKDAIYWGNIKGYDEHKRIWVFDEDEQYYNETFGGNK